MNQSAKSESRYVIGPETDCYIGSVISDIEIIRLTRTNIIASGRRYGRRWFLKGLREELRDSAVMLRQLQKEFEIHSRLRHPSIAQVIGLENIDGLGLCIVQEWVDGITLHDALHKDDLNPSERRRIIRDLTATVAYLHSQGIVHRDLKPSNVMIRQIGREIVLIDFGLADTADYVEIKGAAGTPGFISPEQMMSGGAEPADDVYSLGVIMAEMTPCYARIARQCMNRADKRPADAGRLLRMLRKRDRRPKILITTLSVIAAALIAGVAVQRTITLEQAARDSDMKLKDLRARNTDNIALITSLKDSLSSVQGHLDNTRGKLAEITEYDNLRRSSLAQGCRMIDTKLTQADRKIFSKLTTIEPYNHKVLELISEMKTTVDNYCSSLKTSMLSPEDTEKLRLDLYNYQTIKISEYQEKWLKQINP
ncbi:MAG: serine/threonine protein kinase [Muribaculaceae bacterium]|nr:serine/threonine protein kinase [Muribaculaceae bacterium]